MLEKVISQKQFTFCQKFYCKILDYLKLFYPINIKLTMGGSKAILCHAEPAAGVKNNLVGHHLGCFLYMLSDNPWSSQTHKKGNEEQAKEHDENQQELALVHCVQPEKDKQG